MIKTGQLPKKEYAVVIAPFPEYIIGIDVMRGMTLNLPEGRYQFAVRKI